MCECARARVCTRTLIRIPSATTYYSITHDHDLHHIYNNKYRYLELGKSGFFCLDGFLALFLERCQRLLFFSASFFWVMAFTSFANCCVCECGVVLFILFSMCACPSTCTAHSSVSIVFIGYLFALLLVWYSHLKLHIALELRPEDGLRHFVLTSLEERGWGGGE